MPRVRYPEHGVHLVAVPWARPGSGFTLLFEVAMLTYAKQMPIAPLAKMAREHDNRIWRVIEHHVTAARAGATRELGTSPPQQVLPESRPQGMLPGCRRRGRG